jgi:hypothetical protein
MAKAQFRDTRYRAGATLRRADVEVKAAKFKATMPISENRASFKALCRFKRL